VTVTIETDERLLGEAVEDVEGLNTMRRGFLGTFTGGIVPTGGILLPAGHVHVAIRGNAGGVASSMAGFGSAMAPIGKEASISRQVWRPAWRDRPSPAAAPRRWRPFAALLRWLRIGA